MKNNWKSKLMQPDGPPLTPVSPKSAFSADVQAQVDRFEAAVAEMFAARDAMKAMGLGVSIRYPDSIRLAFSDEAERAKYDRPKLDLSSSF